MICLDQQHLTAPNGRLIRDKYFLVKVVTFGKGTNLL